MSIGEFEHSFIDLVSHVEVVLLVPPGGRLYPKPGEPAIGVKHPNCDRLADVSIELDCFYCQDCRWNGRISGAWVYDLMQLQESSTSTSTGEA